MHPTLLNGSNMLSSSLARALCVCVCLSLSLCVSLCASVCFSLSVCLSLCVSLSASYWRCINTSTVCLHTPTHLHVGDATHTQHKNQHTANFRSPRKSKSSRGALLKKVGLNSSTEDGACTTKLLRTTWRWSTRPPVATSSSSRTLEMLAVHAAHGKSIRLGTRTHRHGR